MITSTFSIHCYETNSVDATQIRRPKSKGKPIQAISIEHPILLMPLTQIQPLLPTIKRDGIDTEIIITRGVPLPMPQNLRQLTRTRRTILRLLSLLIRPLPLLPRLQIHLPRRKTRLTSIDKRPNTTSLAEVKMSNLVIALVVAQLGEGERGMQDEVIVRVDQAQVQVA